MAALLDINDAWANAALDACPSLNNGTIEIRTGNPPGIGAAATGTLLATLGLNATAFAAAAARQRVANAITAAVAAADGTAGYARLKASGGTAVADVKAGGSYIVTRSGNTLTANVNHGYSAGDEVEFFTSGVLINGLVAYRKYYVIAAGLTATQFRVSETLGGGEVTLSDDGTGTQRVKNADVGLALSSSGGGVLAGIDVEVSSLILRAPTVF